MLHTVLDTPPVGETKAARDQTLAAYRLMLTARVLDDKYAALYRGGKIHGGVFLGRGQEALSVAIGISLKKTDIFAPLIRDAAGRLAFGETVVDAIRTYLGSALGPMRGRDGNVHRGRPLEGYLPMVSHLGAMISVVNGTLFARRLKGVSGTVGATCLGDGATSTGAFHEALNQAAVENSPWFWSWPIINTPIPPPPRASLFAMTSRTRLPATVSPPTPSTAPTWSPA